MSTSNNTPSAILITNIERVANIFEAGNAYDYLGYIIEIERKQEPYKFERWSASANAMVVKTKSARYWGKVTTPDGEIIKFEELRGNKIAHKAGIFVREEKERKERATKNNEIWEIAQRFEREQRHK